MKAPYRYTDDFEDELDWEETERMPGSSREMFALDVQ